MAAIKYKNLRILVADDFSNFRNTVSQMLAQLGVVDTHMVSSADEAIDACIANDFDVILCDYNLGSGRTGQHVLEELRYRSEIDYKTLFLILSAETSRSIVMSAYDSEPDDYLMKPITSKMLEQRLNRLLKQREVLIPIHNALSRGKTHIAVDLLTDMSLSETRLAVPAQKMLGEQFIEMGELDKAERVYTKALEARSLDWARLGLAKVKQLRGELDIAGSWLEKIVTDNPLYLPAYDVLADNWDRLGESQHVQSALQRSVDISPMSILRQQRLADVASVNDDIPTALDALRRVVKLGELSCYGSEKNHFDFARMAATASERQLEVPLSLHHEALSVLQRAQEQYQLSAPQLAQFKILSGRINFLEDQTEMAEQLFHEADDLFAEEDLGIDADVERVAAFIATGKKSEAEKLLTELQDIYAGNQPALEKLDCFLNEPASAANREMVAQINQEGIGLYNIGKFDEALGCFEKSRKLFPKHVGIQLNIVQSLIGKMKLGQSDQQVVNECFTALDLVSSLIYKGHPQYQRYSQLKTMANNI